MGNMSSPTRLGARESAAIPPAGLSTGRPARSALDKVGAASGSTPMILIFPAVPGSDSANQTASADGYEQGVEFGTLLFEFQADGSLAEQSFKLIVGVNLQDRK